MKRAYIYWDHIEQDGKIINFPAEPEKLAEIFMKIENGMLGEFCEGCEIEFRQRDSNDLLRQALISLGYRKIKGFDKTEEFLISLTKSMENYKRILNQYRMLLLDIFESLDPTGKYKKGEEKFIKEFVSDEENKSEIINTLKKEYEDLKGIENTMEKSVKSIMERYAPNLSFVAGPILGAELISLTGGLHSLSMMPSSRIQIIGAGKSYYISKKSGRQGPKHGIIFRHPFVHGSKNRGRNARWLANKIAIASRIDFYRKEIDENFTNEVKEKMKKLE
ncbi:MAG: hypothetical protein ACP5T9_00890 [Thermoplasmata archaeon]